MKSKNIFCVQFKYDFSWDEDADTDSLFAVIQSSESMVKISDLQKKFVCKFDLGFDKEDCQLIPVDVISHPLMVHPNYGGVSTERFCVLPQRKWGGYFGSTLV